jgi:hypothetical protein
MQLLIDSVRTFKMAVFPGLDMTDEATIRWVARGLELYLSGSHRLSNNRIMREMNDVQLSTFLRILGQMELDGSFNTMVETLIHRPTNEGDVIVRLGREMLSYEGNNEVS